MSELFTLELSPHPSFAAVVIDSCKPWPPVEQHSALGASQIESRRYQATALSPACKSNCTEEAKVVKPCLTALIDTSATSRWLNRVVSILRTCERLEKDHDDDSCVKRCPSLAELWWTLAFVHKACEIFTIAHTAQEIMRKELRAQRLTALP